MTARVSGWLVVAVFLAMIAAQWRVYGAIPGPDAIAYVTAGVTLVTTGTLMDAAGESQLWFPPFYPLLVGLASGGGAVDAVTAGRLISTAMAVLGLLVTGAIARSLAKGRGAPYESLAAAGYIPALAMAILAANPIYQHSALASLSEATATTMALSAFAVWLRLPERGSPVRYALVGGLVGLSYLSRPEGLILLPLWAGVDLARKGFNRPLIRGYAVAAGAAFLVALPYLLYLYRETGDVALTGKTAINLASGRATYLRLPREYIDPATLEPGFWPYGVTWSGEVVRYFWNLARIVAEYLRNLGALIALPVLVGLGGLIRDRQWRVLFGAGCFFGYLLVLAAFEVKNRYLHLTLPGLSIAAALGAARMFGAAAPEAGKRTAAVVSKAVATALLAGVAVQGFRAMRENLIDHSGYQLLKEGGIRLRELPKASCVVYERYGMIGFYGGCATRMLTSNDLDTILRYVEKREPEGTTVYLSVSSLESGGYHPSVAALLQGDSASPRLRRVGEMAEEGQRVVVYEVGRK